MTYMKTFPDMTPPPLQKNPPKNQKGELTPLDGKMITEATSSHGEFPTMNSTPSNQPNIVLTRVDSSLLSFRGSESLYCITVGIIKFTNI